MSMFMEAAGIKTSDHQSRQYRLEDKLLKYYPAAIQKQNGLIRGLIADSELFDAHPLN